MNYGLVKKLRDAGFPQIGNGFYVGNVGLINPKDVTPGGIVGIAQEDFYYLPTLSELIEACGNTFLSLDSPRIKDTNDKWTASSSNENNYFRQGTGSTPEEAVANLWLKLLE